MKVIVSKIMKSYRNEFSWLNFNTTFKQAFTFHLNDDDLLLFHPKEWKRPHEANIL